MKSTYKYVPALVVLFPIVAALLGGILIYGGFSSFMGFEDIARGRELSIFHIYIGSSLLIGITALLFRYFHSSFYYLGVLVLSLLYSLFIGREGLVQISLVKLFISILAAGALFSICVTKIFYNPALVRFRSVLFGIVAALIMALFYRVLYLFAGLSVLPNEFGFLLGRFVNSLYLFVFIAFGLGTAEYVVKLTDPDMEEEIAEESEDDEELEMLIEDDDESDDNPRPKLPKRSRGYQRR